MKYKNKMTKLNNIFTYEYTYTTDDETKTFILSEHEFNKIEQIEDEKFKLRTKFFIKDLSISTFKREQAFGKCITTKLNHKKGRFKRLFL